MSTYEPGTVAVATVRGVQVRVFRSQDDWISGDDVAGIFWHTEADVTDIRPLVVLDLADFAWAAKVLRNPGLGAMDTRAHIADQIEQQTKRPRIPEPGLWGVVTAGDLTRDYWIHLWANGEEQWFSTGSGVTSTWDDLIDPTLVRPGIEDGAS